MDHIRTRFLRKRDDSSYIHMLEFRRGWSTPMLLPGWPLRLPKPSTVRTLTPRHVGSEDQPLYGVAHWLGRTAPYESIPPRSHAVRGRLHWYRC